MSTAIRWQPFSGLASLQTEVDRLFQGPLSRPTEAPEAASWTPPVDIYESENELVVKADVAGLDEKEIDVRVENNVLTVRGEKKLEKNIAEDNYLRVERTYGAFTRSFGLPNTINPEQIHASYNNGVLTIRLPKREETKPKQIKVNVSTESAK